MINKQLDALFDSKTTMVSVICSRIKIMHGMMNIVKINLF